LLSEDCSTDGTREIVRDYERRYRGTIRLLLSKENVRTNAVVARGIEAARGEYVALLDGDDFWLSPFKLKKQVDFLDAHPECSICFHNARVIREEGTDPSWNWTPSDHPEITTLEHLLLGNFIATCSTMYRRGLIEPIPSWYDTFFPITDWPLHILNAEQGHIGYINEVLGVYRYHSGGLYSPMDQRQKLAATLRFYRRINACLDYRYDRQIRAATSKYFIEWAEEYLNRNDREAARACFQSYLTGRPLNRYISIRRMLRMAFRLYAPDSK
ncbi:MAG: glycosyltransferase, partial [Rhodothermales bacterium]